MKKESLSKKNKIKELSVKITRIAQLNVVKGGGKCKKHKFDDANTAVVNDVIF